MPSTPSACYNGASAPQGAQKGTITMNKRPNPPCQKCGASGYLNYYLSGADDEGNPIKMCAVCRGAQDEGEATHAEHSH